MTDQETASEGTDELELRAWAAKLFAPAEDDETAETGETTDETAKPTGNYVPNEGNVPAAKDNSDEQFIRILFDNN